jgi:universal stress protein A
MIKRDNDMLHYKSVLCAVDFSKESQEVVGRAKMIADHSDAAFNLVHVLEHTPVAYAGGEFALPLDLNLEEVLREHAKTSLQKMADGLNSGDIPWHLIEGPIKHGVIDLAKDLSADLIVVGSHGHHGMGMLLGGNASGILHGAHCSVLAVHVD